MLPLFPHFLTWPLDLRPTSFSYHHMLVARKILDDAFQSDNDYVINVIYNKDCPNTTHSPNDIDEYTIYLTATSDYWGQFVYQFAHEYCHVLINSRMPHEMAGYFFAWFEEAICELASLYVLQTMVSGAFISNDNKEWWRLKGKGYIEITLNQTEAPETFSVWFNENYSTLLSDYPASYSDAALKAEARMRGNIIAQALLNCSFTPQFWCLMAKVNRRQHLCTSLFEVFMDDMEKLSDDCNEAFACFKGVFYQR